MEVHSALADSEMTLDATQVRESVEEKFAKNKKYLLKSLRTAIIDEEKHLTEGESRRYVKFDKRYCRADTYDAREIIAETRKALSD